MSIFANQLWREPVPDIKSRKPMSPNALAALTTAAGQEQPEAVRQRDPGLPRGSCRSSRCRSTRRRSCRARR